METDAREKLSFSDTHRRTHSYSNISNENNFSIQEILKKQFFYFLQKKDDW